MGKALKVIGATALGFVAGILLAPKSGKETRKDIKNKASKAKTYAGGKAGHLKNVATKSAHEVGDEAKGFAKSARGSAAIVSTEAGRLADEAKTRAARVAEEAKRASRSVQKDTEEHPR
jgi:gas vesicle protein